MTATTRVATSVLISCVMVGVAWALPESRMQPFFHLVMLPRSIPCVALTNVGDKGLGPEAMLVATVISVVAWAAVILGIIGIITRFGARLVK